MNKHEWLSHKNWAVVGASAKEDSYGHKISARLLQEGYKLIPISIKYDDIEGHRAYPSLLAYEGEIDVVNFVVNPTIGMTVLDDVIARGIKKILLQPGTASKALVEKAEANGIEVLQSCILVLLSWR